MIFFGLLFKFIIHILSTHRAYRKCDKRKQIASDKMSDANDRGWSILVSFVVLALPVVDVKFCFSLQLILLFVDVVDVVVMWWIAWFVVVAVVLFLPGAWTAARLRSRTTIFVDVVGGALRFCRNGTGTWLTTLAVVFRHVVIAVAISVMGWRSGCATWPMIHGSGTRCGGCIISGIRIISSISNVRCGNVH